jgi:histidyl-tRNA synthetase
MENKVTPRILQGFVELLPADQLAFEDMKDKIENVYKRFGFVPLDTPTLEYSEVLLAKAGGETEKQIYRFTHHDTDVSLRFDLTVPLARYVAQHFPDLSFPFKRYQISKSFRGERPQKGRYREFYQCDIDVIGSDTLDLCYDAEMTAAINTVFTEFNIGDFVIRINNRKILTGFFGSLGLGDITADVMRTIDKMPKIGAEKTQEELTKLGVGAEALARINEFTSVKGTNAEKIAALRSLCTDGTFNIGVDELESVIKTAYALGVPEKNLEIDLSIVRGLDYYTGTVYETFIVGHEDFGSVCSGGRYDDLAGFYTDKKLPGVGASIGLSRLFAQLRDNGIVSAAKRTTADVLILPTGSDRFAFTAKIADRLRNAGIATDVYWSDRSLKAKFKYADRAGVKFVAVIGESEEAEGKMSLRRMDGGEQVSVTAEEAIEIIRK